MRASGADTACCSISPLILTMALCGLWHVASWTCVLGGTLHGCALVIVSLWRRYGRPLPFVLGWAMTVVFAFLTAVIFRAGTLEAAWRIYQGLAIAPDWGAISGARPI